jgi:hypothetical protein
MELGWLMRCFALSCGRSRSRVSRQRDAVLTTLWDVLGLAYDPRALESTLQNALRCACDSTLRGGI